MWFGQILFLFHFQWPESKNCQALEHMWYCTCLYLSKWKSNLKQYHNFSYDNAVVSPFLDLKKFRIVLWLKGIEFYIIMHMPSKVPFHRIWMNILKKSLFKLDVFDCIILG